MRLLWQLYLRLNGWQVDTRFPNHLQKCIIIVAPHTSSWDFIIGLAVRSVLRLHHVKYLGKAELFKGPFGFFFRLMGGYPVERSEKHQMVEQVADLFNTQERFVLALSPEGTRKRVDRLRTGFYHIARKANVPIVMAALDFGRKQVYFSDPFYAGVDEAADFKRIIDFYAPVMGKIPEYGLSHLQKPVSETQP
ncbi:MAG: acyltransferase [Chitinophagaceae bacterium]|jgi:1-acyl-sn-glycerol-3-phosphate acyltransferase|nr:acyltransferase [Chitinophagaceae bacterium]